MIQQGLRVHELEDVENVKVLKVSHFIAPTRTLIRFASSINIIYNVNKPVVERCLHSDAMICYENFYVKNHQ